MTYRIAPSVSRLLLLQCLSGLVFAGILLVWQVDAAISGLIGAGIAVVPNVYFALRVFDMSKGRNAGSTLRAMFVGAVGKFVVTMVLFWLAFMFLSPLHAPALFGGFALAQLMNWVSLLMNGNKNGQRKTASP